MRAYEFWVIPFPQVCYEAEIFCACKTSAKLQALSRRRMFCPTEDTAPKPSEQLFCGSASTSITYLCHYGQLNKLKNV